MNESRLDDLVSGPTIADLLLDEALERSLMPLYERDEVLSPAPERAPNELQVVTGIPFRGGGPHST